MPGLVPAIPIELPRDHRDKSGADEFEGDRFYGNLLQDVDAHPSTSHARAAPDGARNSGEAIQPDRRNGAYRNRGDPERAASRRAAGAAAVPRRQRRVHYFLPA